MKDYSMLEKAAFGYKQTNGNEATTSFLGGTPYITDVFHYPVDKDNVPLAFFGQVDLTNVDEKIKEQLNLPVHGYLQFYHGIDDLMGMDLDNADMRDNVTKVLYLKDAFDDDNFKIPEVEEDSGDADEWDEKFSPLNEPVERVYLVGEIFQMMPYPNSIDAPVDNKENKDEYFDFYEERGESFHSLWLGGYPHFTQTDFREYHEYTDEDRPVLLAGSESTDHTLWGDVGVGGFWLPQKNIDDRSFDKSFIYWDCG